MNDTKNDTPNDEHSKSAENSGRSLGIELLRSVGHTLVPVVLAAGSLIGFIALAGSAIVWTRFSAAEIPPDQVVAVYPRDQLVALASALLLVFGLVGLLAVMMCYLIDRGGRATIGMTRGLLTLLGVEGLAVIIFIAKHDSTQQWLVAAALFVGCLAACACMTFLHEDPAVPEGKSDNSRLAGLRRSFFEATAASLALAVLVGLAGLVAYGTSAWVLFTALCVFGLCPPAWLAWHLREGTGRPSKGELGDYKVPFTRRGMVSIAALLAAAVILPSAWVHNGWLLPLSLIAAVALFTGLWRAAVLPKKPFLWYGLAVFASVPLFGTLTWMIQNVTEPQVQPMAMIRKGDGADEYLQGLFVTETDNRVYFATIATKGCSNDLLPDSGRLLSVPQSEVAAMAIGPLQSVTEARKAALEMAYALAPASAAPAPDAVSLTSDEKRAAAARQRPPNAERRLEGAGAAVQPVFGLGLRVEPEVASPGEVVTLRMNTPGKKIGGFGSSRHHRTLRVGGVPAVVVKEAAHLPWEAEYVETEDGRALKLARHSVYVALDGGFSSINRSSVAPNTPLYVRISDKSVLSVDGRQLKQHPNVAYLLLGSADTWSARLDEEDRHLPLVRLRDGSKLSLEPVLLRQAWHMDHIDFRVPEGSSTGDVNIECKQLASVPLLRVAQPPEARISVRVTSGDRVVFDSGRSRDANGRIVSRHWRVQGLESGRTVKLAEMLPPRPQGYLIRLTVVDSDGQEGATEVRLFRLPASLIRFDGRGGLKNERELKPIREEMTNAIEVDAPESVELDARPAGVFGGHSAAIALRNAKAIGRDLLGEAPAGVSAAGAASEGPTVRTLAYGTGCGSSGVSASGRFDVLILGSGVQILSSRDCPPVRSQTTHHLLVPR